MARIAVSWALRWLFLGAIVAAVALAATCYRPAAAPDEVDRWIEAMDRAEVLKAKMNDGTPFEIRPADPRWREHYPAADQR